MSIQSREPQIYDTTFTYIINAADTPVKDRLHTDNLNRIVLSSEWRQPMGSYLPQNKKFNCRTIRYEWGINYIFDGQNSLDMFTQIYSDINDSVDNKNTLAIDKLNTNRLNPISNFSNMCSRYNGIREGGSRSSVNIVQDCQFMCDNFNQKTKYFRLNTIIKNKPVNQFSPETNITSQIYAPSVFCPTNGDSISLGYYNGKAIFDFPGGVNQDVLYSYVNAPITTLLMTPVPEPYEPIPRLLLKEDSIIYTISSFERTKNLFKNFVNQVLDSGAHCVIPFKRIDSRVRKYKAQVIGFNFNTLLVDTFYNKASANGFSFSFGFRTSTSNFNASKYGYLGDHPLHGVEEEIVSQFGGIGGNGFSILVDTIRPCLDNDIDRQYPISYSTVWDINNENTDVEFAVFNNMNYIMGKIGANNTAFPFKDLINPKFDWNLTLRLYPIE
jgi:hypothetical protein